MKLASHWKLVHISCVSASLSYCQWLLPCFIRCPFHKYLVLVMQLENSANQEDSLFILPEPEECGSFFRDLLPLLTQWLDSVTVRAIACFSDSGLEYGEQLCLVQLLGCRSALGKKIYLINKYLLGFSELIMKHCSFPRKTWWNTLKVVAYFHKLYALCTCIS